MANALAAVIPPQSEDEADEYLEVQNPPGHQYEDTEDGGLVITMDTAAVDVGEPDEDGFYANLATKTLPDSVLDRIATDLLQKIEEDKVAREPRDKQYEDGMRRTGLGKDAPGGATFQGASKAVHPMMTEACIDFQSRVMKELWPPSGPCKQKIIGEATKQKAEKAKRKTEYMNYQLTTKIREARNVVETMLSQLPLGGSQFIRLWFDHRLRRPRMKFISVDKIYLPDSAESYASADRRTFSDTITTVEMKRRMASDIYRHLDLGPSPMKPEASKTEEANRKVEGVQPGSLNIDGDREIYETMAYLEITSDMADALGGVEEEGDLCPYLITIDVTSRKILSFYRDWEEDDETKEPIEHLFEFPFLPWRGAYAIGLPQVIGGLSGAATGSLRALLDSALIANTQGGFILKGSGTGAQVRQPNPNEFIEIESGMEAADIRQKVMPFATKEPSQALFSLLGFLVEAGKGAIRTSMDESAIDTNTNVPVGTQLSRVEEGLVVFSSIHARIHAAFNRLLEGLHRLNRLYLPKNVRENINGTEILIRRRDFEGSADVQPVTDPTIYSDQQRMGQVNAMQQRAAMVPGLYNVMEVEKWFLQLMKVPDADRFLTPQPQPHELNAINENLAMGLGRPVVAFPDQDHLAHLQAHFDFADSPVLGSNPIIAQTYMPAFVKHCAEHILYHYVQRTTELVKEAAGVDAKELFSKDDRVKVALDRLLAQASNLLVPTLTQDFTSAVPIIKKALMVVEAMQPKPPVDPAVVAGQAAAAETQRKTAADQGKAQTDAARLEIEAGKAKGVQERDAAAQRLAQGEMVVDLFKIAADKDKAALDSATKLRINAEDNDTAIEIATNEILAGHRTNLSTGSSIGKK